MSPGNGVYSFELDSHTISFLPETEWPADAVKFFGACAYDFSRQRVLWYGGWSNSTPANPTGVYEDLWICDLAAPAGQNRWSRVQPGAVWPGPLWEVNAAIDPTRDRLVLFGGRRPSATNPLRCIYSDLTYEMNLATYEWTLTPTATSPLRRGYNAMCWDPDRARIHTYGGIFHETVDYIATLNDVWTFRPSPAGWQVALPRGPIPTSRRMALLAYDTLRHRLIVVGGQHLLIVSDLFVTAEIKIPRNGAVIGGNSVTVMAELTSGNPALVANIRFQYRTSGYDDNGQAVTPGEWTNIPPADPIQHPNPDPTEPWFIHWDVSAMPNQRVDLRAVATGTNGVYDPVPAESTILIDQQNGTNYASAPTGETVVSGVVSAGTCSDFSAASRNTASNLLVRVDRETCADPAVFGVQCRTGDPAGVGAGIGYTFDLTCNAIGSPLGFQKAQTGTALSSSTTTTPAPGDITLLCTYPDSDNDGFVDGTSIPESTLRWCLVDGPILTPLITSETDPERNMLRAETTATGTYGVFPIETAGVGGWPLIE